MLAAFYANQGSRLPEKNFTTNHQIKFLLVPWYKDFGQQCNNLVDIYVQEEDTSKQSTATVDQSKEKNHITAI